MLSKLILKNRSYRRFYQTVEIDEQSLLQFIDAARLSPSPRNQQALKYFYSNKSKTNQLIFETLSWAGALPDWNGPVEGERPSAYIIILADNKIIGHQSNSYIEAACGIAAQSVLLSAVEKKFGGCIIAAVKRNILQLNLNIPEHLEILLVIALGKPKEKIILDEMPEDNNYNYRRDENDNHHVPKRSLNEVIINNKIQ